MTEDEKDKNKDEHDGFFAEGQAKEEHDPEEDRHGDFAEGQEQEHHEPAET